YRDWSSDVCSSDLTGSKGARGFRSVATDPERKPLAPLLPVAVDDERVAVDLGAVGALDLGLTDRGVAHYLDPADAGGDLDAADVRFGLWYGAVFGLTQEPLGLLGCQLAVGDLLEDAPSVHGHGRTIK